MLKDPPFALGVYTRNVVPGVDRWALVRNKRHQMEACRECCLSTDLWLDISWLSCSWGIFSISIIVWVAVQPFHCTFRVPVLRNELESELKNGLIASLTILEVLFSPAQG
jgi:hypothetical protein